MQTPCRICRRAQQRIRVALDLVEKEFEGEDPQHFAATLLMIAIEKELEHGAQASRLIEFLASAARNAAFERTAPEAENTALEEVDDGIALAGERARRRHGWLT